MPSRKAIISKIKHFCGMNLGWDKTPSPSFTGKKTMQLQLSHMTKEDRFPKIMESAKQLKPDARRILSFGCSTGEECQALAKTFPSAEIVGVDIDSYSIDRARRNNKFKDRVFYQSDVKATGKYDLVTCFMVLFALDSPIPYERWESVIKIIDGTVAPNGLLMIYTSDHDFKAWPGFQNYEIVRDWIRTHNKNNKEYFNGYYKKKPKIINSKIHFVDMVVG